MLIPNQRHLFDIPEDIAYLNCAYISPSLKSVIEAGRQGMERKSKPWKIKTAYFFDESEQARTLFAELLGTKSDNIAIIPATSYGIATASRNLPLESGQNVVVMEEQFPSNYYGWLEKAKKASGNLVVVKRPQKRSISSALCDAINEATAIVALPNCHWTDGAIIDIQAVSKRCQEKGAALVLDLAQSAGVMSFPLADIDPDFIVAPSYKWLLGPYSLGFLYVAPRQQQGEPLEHNWINRANSEDFAGLVNYREEFQPGARKFDVGERSNFALMPMAVAALEQLLSWGVDNIAETLTQFTGEIGERADKLGLNITSLKERSPHMMGIRFMDGVPSGLLKKLAERNVFVSVRGNSVRVSPHLYNNSHDIDRLFEALAALL
tara:strand:+ start:6883 stop:8019 length:1137 start_codon:yes stop_codon:yes gene_type:complete